MELQSICSKFQDILVSGFKTLHNLMAKVILENFSANLQKLSVCGNE